MKRRKIRMVKKIENEKKEKTREKQFVKGNEKQKKKQRKLKYYD